MISYKGHFFQFAVQVPEIQTMIINRNENCTQGLTCDDYVSYQSGSSTSNASTMPNKRTKKRRRKKKRKKKEEKKRVTAHKQLIWLLYITHSYKTY